MRLHKRSFVTPFAGESRFAWRSARQHVPEGQLPQENDASADLKPQPNRSLQSKWSPRSINRVSLAEQIGGVQ